MPVAVRVDGMRHFIISAPVGQQAVGSLKIACSSRPTSLTEPASIASGRSVFSRRTRTGLPSDGASSWTPPGIGQDNLGRLHQVDERLVILRLDQEDIIDLLQHFVNDIAHLRVPVDRDDEEDLAAELFRQPLDRPADRFDRLAEAFAPVGGSRTIFLSLTSLIPALARSKFFLATSSRASITVLPVR